MVLDDERAQTFEPSPEIDPRTLELAKTIINKLKFTYKPNNFKNPKLQMFWAHLEALALEYDAPDTVQDDTGRIFRHFLQFFSSMLIIFTVKFFYIKQITSCQN